MTSQSQNYKTAPNTDGNKASRRQLTRNGVEIDKKAGAPSVECLWALPPCGWHMALNWSGSWVLTRSRKRPAASLPQLRDMAESTHDISSWKLLQMQQWVAVEFGMKSCGELSCASIRCAFMISLTENLISIEEDFKWNALYESIQTIKEADNVDDFVASQGIVISRSPFEIL